MAHIAQPRLAVTLVLCICLAFSITDAHSTTRKRTKHHHTTTTSTTNTSTTGFVVRRSPWAALNELPNFTEGVWSTAALASDATPPLKAEIAAATAAEGGTPLHASINSGTDSCSPLGMPAVMLQPEPFEFIYAPDRITMLLERDSQVRRIYTDGRAHPDNPSLTHSGHSIGHWERNILVVDTVGVIPGAHIAPNVSADGPIHITERMHLTTLDNLTIDTTVEAPSVLSKPWTYSTNYQRHRDRQMQEYLCSKGFSTHD